MEPKQRKANRLQVGKKVGPMLDAYYEDLQHARDDGKLVAWVLGGPGPIFPLLFGMDIAVLHGQSYAARVAGRKEEKELIELSEAEGYPPDLCSYARPSIGCVIGNQRGFPGGIVRPIWRMPPPDLLVSIDVTCSTQNNWFDYLRRTFNVPSYEILLPHHWTADPSDVARREAYVVEELKEFITFIEGVTGRSYQWDRVEVLLEKLKRMATLRAETIKLCHTIPAPASVFDMFGCVAPINLLMDRPGVVEFYEELKLELQQRVDEKVASVPDERYRLFFEGLPPWFAYGELSETLAGWGACVVSSRYTDLGFFWEPAWVEPKRPLETVAKYASRIHLNKSPEWLAGEFVQLCRDYSVDGMMLHATRTCRATANNQLLIAEDVCREVGIPMCSFEGDMTDRRHYSKEQVEARIATLLEAIDISRNAKAS